MNTKEDLHIFLHNKENHENILITTHAQSENPIFESILHIKQTNNPQPHQRR
jgi:hypothetical protein